MGKPVIILAVAVVLLLVGLGVYMKASAPFEVDVITKHNEYCKVHEGDSRSEVRKRTTAARGSESSSDRGSLFPLGYATCLATHWYWPSRARA